ncbi:hypothetical protein B1R32_10341 [Abditibacterium utsteinense]|uniref:Uncharacterized protein n=1 Tax=Abditibacterium utsteinense TaxID=1960156 RepID=A0A2S8SVG7_9BACT|nr:hypothetical protein [Abditibacterium utsteinense]PQV64774.1 hypothetical protein B1R32_10341 [Abditibacterium utsteinense]
MQLKPRTSFRFSRFAPLLAGAAMASATLFGSAPAHADKAKTLKYGAIGLGAVSAYLFAKGKTVPAAAAAAGGYYAYKKSQNAKNEQRYGYYPSYGSNNGSSEAVYPDSNSDSAYDSGYNANYNTQYRSNATVRNRREERRESRRESRGNRFDLSPYQR